MGNYKLKTGRSHQKELHRSQRQRLLHLLWLAFAEG
jgi:hypothetical protein